MNSKNYTKTAEVLRGTDKLTATDGVAAKIKLADCAKFEIFGKATVGETDSPDDFYKKVLDTLKNIAAPLQLVPCIDKETESLLTDGSETLGTLYVY
jgi:hypothetical protein